MSTIFSLTQCINPTFITKWGLSCVVTSRQVYSGIDIYPESNISFQLCSYSTFATGRRETRDFHPPLNTFQVCSAGTRKILRFNFFPLKSVGKLQRFMPFLWGQPNTQDSSWIPLDTLMPRQC